jgi:hypothetical protein
MDRSRDESLLASQPENENIEKELAEAKDAVDVDSAKRSDLEELNNDKEIVGISVINFPQVPSARPALEPNNVAFIDKEIDMDG